MQRVDLISYLNSHFFGLSIFWWLRCPVTITELLCQCECVCEFVCVRAQVSVCACVFVCVCVSATITWHNNLICDL